MKPLLSVIILPLLLLGSALPNPAWGLFQLLTKENHPELHWRTLTTEHFRIHYHQGLEQTARECADVAEQVYGPVTTQLGVTPPGRTELGITDSDQIVNGFTFRNQIGIWVHQNEYARQFSQPREWLRQVIAHEFQHAVTFQALRDWRGQLGLALSGTPAWWMEGLAEYYTENWNVLRSDKALRAETLDERLSQSEAHDGGYARVLYLAWRDGDSTLVKICAWRHPVLKTYSFEKAFKACTGQSPEAFEQEWRRTLNGLYNAELAAHEPVDEIGQRVQLPLTRVRWLALLPDSSAWLVVGRDSLSRGDNALYRVTCDSTQRVERLADGFLAGQAALAEDGSRVVFDRWSWDRHGSNEMDLWELDLRTRRERRLTRDERASDPALAPDGALVYVTNQGGRSRLLLRESSGEPRVLWDPGADWQLFHPSFSPDGRRVAVASDDPNSRKGITLLDRSDGRVTALELRYEDERDPVWIRDSLLVTTVFEQQRANLLARGLDGSCARISDSGEGLWSVSRMPQSQGGGLIALALDSARVSRPLLVDPARRTEAHTLQLQPRYTAWRDQLPLIRCAEWQRDQHAVIQSDTRYNALELRPRATVALPLPTGFFAMSMLTDPLLHNQLTVAGGLFDRDQPTALLSLGNYSFAWSLTLAAGWQAGYDLTVRDNELHTVHGSFLAALVSRRLRVVSRPYSEINLGLETRLQNSEWLGSADSMSPPFSLRNSRSGSLAGTIAWRESPPERDTFWWPRWAHGLQLHGAALRPWIHGEEHVDCWSAQAFRIQPTPLPNLKGFLSARLDGLSGRRETWRALGFGQDLLLSPLEISGLSGGVVGLPLGPTSELRALQRELAGDRIFQATAELRLTLGTPKLFQLLGVENARVNVAPFADVGQVADRSRLAPGEPALWLWTSGLEAQVGLKSEGLTLLSLGVGVGSEDLDWLRSSHTRYSYWRIHLSRPF